MRRVATVLLFALLVFARFATVSTHWQSVAADEGDDGGDDSGDDDGDDS